MKPNFDVCIKSIVVNIFSRKKSNLIVSMHNVFVLEFLEDQGHKQTCAPLKSYEGHMSPIPWPSILIHSEISDTGRATCAPPPPSQKLGGTRALPPPPPPILAGMKSFKDV